MRLLSVEVTRHVGWVYDATTGAGAFSCDGIVVKNCGRSSSPRPDIASKRDAEHARPSTTEAQRADQAAAEARRTESVAARAQRRRLEQQVSRRADGILSDSGNRVTSPAAARAIARRESRARRERRAAG